MGNLTKARAVADAGSVKRSANHAEVQTLVKDALDKGHVLTTEERDLVVQHVAGAWFDPRKSVKVVGIMAGIAWEGRILVAGDTVSAEAAHYLKHVQLRKEWPAGTTLDDYRTSGIRIVEGRDSALAVSLYRGQMHVTFFGRSGMDNGSGGADLIMVDYRVREDAIRTAYQPAKGTDVMLERDRKNVIWIREPI